MVCSASSNKRLLAGINIGYVLIAFIMIGVATYAKNSNKINSLPVIGGIIACGIFLLLVAVLGVLATFKESQKMLFYYMIIVVILFVLQFSISCVCLGVDKERELRLAGNAWKSVDHTPFDVIHDVEDYFQCCGLDADDQRITNNATVPWGAERVWCRQSSLSWEQPCKLTPPPAAASPTVQIDATTANPSNTTETTIITTVSTASPNNTTIAPNPEITTTSTYIFVCPTCSEKLESKIDYAFNTAGGLGLFFAFTEFIAVAVAYIYRKQCNNVTIIT